MTNYPRAASNARGERKIRKNLMLTPSAVDCLTERASALGLSISEYLERFARNELPDVVLVPLELGGKENLGKLLPLLSRSGSG